MWRKPAGISSSKILRQVLSGGGFVCPVRYRSYFLFSLGHLVQATWSLWLRRNAFVYSDPWDRTFIRLETRRPRLGVTRWRGRRLCIILRPVRIIGRITKLLPKECELIIKGKTVLLTRKIVTLYQRRYVAIKYV